MGFLAAWWAGGLMEVDWVAMPGGRLQMQGAPWPEGPVWSHVGVVVTAGQSTVTTGATNAPGDAGFPRMIWLR